MSCLSFAKWSRPQNTLSYISMPQSLPQSSSSVCIYLVAGLSPAAFSVVPFFPPSLIPVIIPVIEFPFAHLLPPPFFPSSFLVSCTSLLSRVTSLLPYCHFPAVPLGPHPQVNSFFRFVMSTLLSDTFLFLPLYRVGNHFARRLSVFSYNLLPDHTCFHSRMITAWLMIQTSFSRSSYTVLAYIIIFVLNKLKRRL